MSAGPRFASDPLGWLDDFAASGRAVGWMGPRQLCVGDARLARRILRNEGDLYADHSDFFGTRAGMFGPRSLQVEVGRRGRSMVENHLRTADFAAAIAGLGTVSEWPRAGNRLMLGLTGPLLTGGHRSRRFNALLDRIVDEGILNRDAARRGAWRRRLRRFRFFLAFATERERWQSRGGGAHRDLLDLVFDLGREAPTEQLVEIYLGFVFSLVSSVGFALSWSVMLAVRHGETAERPRNLVSEALRLYPVAWLLGRRPRVEHELAGTAVGPADEVVVCPYAVHRNPAHWQDPTDFLPGRWRRSPDRTAWLPFGAGEHTCAAVSLTFQILDRTLSELFGPYSARILESSDKPGVGAALAPPPFALELVRR
jgi:Cytochrome P450